MRRRQLIALLSAAAAWPLATRAQLNAIRRIGVLMAVADSDSDVQRGLAVFRQSLGELGWQQGKNLRFEYR